MMILFHPCVHFICFFIRIIKRPNNTAAIVKYEMKHAPMTGKILRVDYRKKFGTIINRLIIVLT